MTSGIESHRVTEASEILKELFNIAYSALYEPSFHVSDWAAIKEMFSRVIERRLDVVESLQAHFTFLMTWCIATYGRIQSSLLLM